MKYADKTENILQVENFQQVPLTISLKESNPTWSRDDILKEQMKRGSYACKDNWENALWNDDAKLAFSNIEYN